MITKEEFFKILEMSMSDDSAIKDLAITLLKSKIGDFNEIWTIDEHLNIVHLESTLKSSVVLLAYVAGYVDDSDRYLVSTPEWLTDTDQKYYIYMDFNKIPFLKKDDGIFLPKHVEFHFNN